MLESDENLLSQAYESDDELAIQAALIFIRSRAMGLSSFFDAIVEDAEKTLLTGSWPKISDDYSFPKKYNYPYDN
ncbi:MULTISPECIES: hypothetical protein [Pseudomonas]|uniref:hypothetical protein n=1 Tax=Pseudomonas TaxID=286 RepID=UPI001C65D14B|nr:MULTISPECIES: hypothetical protein [unclassified Pseudomonas]MBW8130273.1 hypothetical protein [Pseudomonas sp. LAP_36]MBW8139411.1 hypothetical protein [Pseudomonas sp. PAMC 26818]